MQSAVQPLNERKKTMKDNISQLDDTTAIRMLNTVTQAKMRMDTYKTDWTPETRQALQDAFDIPPSESQASEGDIARQSLLLLAEDPGASEVMKALLKNPTARSFADAGTVAVITAALVILQTHVRFERDKNGKIKILIERKSLSDGLLKPMVEKLLSYIPEGPFEGK